MKEQLSDQQRIDLTFKLRDGKIISENLHSACRGMQWMEDCLKIAKRHLDAGDRSGADYYYLRGAAQHSILENDLGWKRIPQHYKYFAELMKEKLNAHLDLVRQKRYVA